MTAVMVASTRSLQKAPIYFFGFGEPFSDGARDEMVRQVCRCASVKNPSLWVSSRLIYSLATSLRGR